MISSLPDFADIDSSYESAVKQIRELYDGLTDYQKAFISEDDVTKLGRYERLLESMAEKEE